MRFSTVAIFAMIGLGGCATVTPGEVTIQVAVCGTSEDVDRYTVIHGGRYWSSPCSEFYKIPTREQRAVWTRSANEGSPNDESITFSGIDGQPVNIDMGIGYMVNAESDDDIIKMVRTYGPDLEVTIDSRVRDSARDALNMCAAADEYTVQDIYGAKKDELLSCAEKSLQEEFNDNGLIVTRLTLNSEIRLPPTIKSRMEEAQAATQEADKVRRQVEMTKAEGEKRVAAAEAAAAARKLEAESTAEAMQIRAEAEAEANRIITRSLTPEVLKMRQLEIQLKQAERWDGKLPQTIMGSEVPMIMVEK
jgi:regulator of protease activity HflC (stomatin/prohibitin superfamily)